MPHSVRFSILGNLSSFRQRLLSLTFVACLLAFLTFPGRGAPPQPPNPPPALEYAPKTVLIAFKNKATAALRVNVLTRQGLTMDTRVKSPFFVRAKISPAAQAAGKDVKAVLVALRKDPSVRVAEPDWIVHATAMPNDPRFPELWGLHNTGQTGGTSDADIDAPEAWELQRGSSAVKVAVIDTGVDYTHPDLAANIARDANGQVLGWDFANGDSDPMDDNGHGTHTSGTIGAVGNNALGVAGVCHSVSIMPLKFLGADGSGSLSGAIQAIDLARMFGAHILSNSWGGGGYSQLMLEAIQRAQAQGILFVAAAGNSSSNNDSTPQYPANYNAYLENVMSVAATDHRDLLADFSSYGRKSVDIAAPGVDVLSTTPGNTYSVYSGTSMATPHVAGVAALIKAQYPGLSSLQLKTRLMANADRLSALVGLVKSGRLNARNALVVDTVAPSAPALLTVTHRATSVLRLQWQAGGDDGSAGTAYLYELRYSPTPINPANFDQASRAVDLLDPAPSGATQSFLLTGLRSETSYYIALRASDDAGNRSEIVYAQGATTTLTSILTDGAEGAPLFFGDAPWAFTTEQRHSGSRAYTDSPGGDYANDLDIALTQSGAVNINADYAEVSFWAKYDLESGYDYVYVEVSTNGGATWERLDFALNGTQDWTSYTIPLVGFAGQNVQIRFRLITDNSVTRDGVYLDDIRIGKASPPVIWLMDNVEGTSLFNRDAPWAATTQQAASPTRSYTDSPGGDYANDLDIALTQSGTLLLPTDSIPILSYRLRHDLEDGYDYLQTEISTDGGATWQTLTSITGTSDGNFRNYAVFLSPFMGQTIKVRFRLITDFSIVEDGVYLDDIKLSGQPLTPVSSLASTRVTVAGITGIIGRTAVLRAWLRRTAGATNIAGKTLTFRLNGVALGTAVTDASGLAVLNYAVTGNLGTGNRTLTAEFAGDGSYYASSGSALMTVSYSTRVDVVSLSGKRGQSVQLRATLRRLPDYIPLGERWLTFRIDGVTVGTAPLGEDKIARLSYTLPAGLANGTHTITVEFAGDNDYLFGSSAATLTVIP